MSFSKKTLKIVSLMLRALILQGEEYNIEFKNEIEAKETFNLLFNEIIIQDKIFMKSDD